MTYKSRSAQVLQEAMKRNAERHAGDPNYAPIVAITQGIPVMKAAFNTGALYTALGQRITCQLVGNWAVFKDHDRMIDGGVSTPNPHLIDSPLYLANHVMHAYLHSQFEHSMRYHRVRDDTNSGDVLSPQAHAIQAMGDYDAWIAEHGVVIVPEGLPQFWRAAP